MLIIDYPVLAKYKLVAISPINSAGYFGIAITRVTDINNNNVYIVNRGTTLTYNDIHSDLNMVKYLCPGHFSEAIKFTKKVIEHYKVVNLGFTGHSLGGSIAQALVVYFDGNSRKRYSYKCVTNF